MTRRPERDLQIAVAAYLRLALPADWAFTSSAAGVPMSPKVAGEMKAMGQNPGWSDLILRQRGTGETRWLELKSKDGRLSPAQIEFRNDCPKNWALARTLEDVEATLIDWGIPLKHRLV